MSKSDMICQWKLYIHPLIDLVKESGVGLKFTRQYYEMKAERAKQAGSKLFTPMAFDKENPQQTYVYFGYEDSIYNKNRLLKMFKPKLPKGKKEMPIEEDCFTLVTHKKVKDEDYKCSLKLDLRIVTAEFSEKNPVGVGRSDPNLEPYLAPPVNRLSLTDPLRFIGHLCSEEIMRKICALLCGIVCIAILIYILPTLFTNLTAIGFGNLFGIN